MKRGPEDDGILDRPAKRLASFDTKDLFRADLFNQDILAEYTSQYARSAPYQHGVISSLLEDSLLRSVRTEITQKISFTPKETDIYRIHQSGDLANLDGLPKENLKELPSLLRLRDALYSHEFRDYLSSITGAGSLSGSRTDMAVNVYTPGSHLLCHDDVIGTRRVSYILYLTDPDNAWKEEWGGALRLYPTRPWKSSDGHKIKVPEHTHTVSIPPAFNQLSFFAVQPGESFHDVEEVYASESHSSTADESRIRIAISGWYHIPQPGEEGYDPTAEAKQAQRSSLAQLQGEANEYDLPQSHRISYPQDNAISNDLDASENTTEMTEADLNFLIKYINPRYLVPDTVAELVESFSNESSLRLSMFLSDKCASELKAQIAAEEESQAITQPENEGWTIARPPHKHRFLFRQPRLELESTTTANVNSNTTHPSPLDLLLNDLFPSFAFKKWLALATGLTLRSCDVLARRFRRGKDYTLATGYEEEQPRLEVCLGITPSRGWDIDEEEDDHQEVSSQTNGAEEKQEPDPPSKAQENPNDNLGVGGYEMYMSTDDAPPSSTNGNNAADPAIYRSTGASTADAEDDDGILFKMPACWNGLSIVLRDQGTLKFVKYVSQAARGDRWDVVGNWAVEAEDDTEDEEDDEEEAETERGFDDDEEDDEDEDNGDDAGEEEEEEEEEEDEKEE